MHLPPIATLFTRWLTRVLVVVGLMLVAQQATAQAEDQTILDAREALRKKDANKLATARDTSRGHALAQWVDYWELSNRLNTASAAEVDAFYARWPGSYVEDRLRNDWLLELGRRRDWVNLKRDYPRFRMNDDREVNCYVLLTEHLDGKDVREAARAAWFEQREADDGCTLLASTLFQAGQFSEADAWQKARLSVLANRPAAARSAAALVGSDTAIALTDVMSNPARTLKRNAVPGDGRSSQLATLALLRLARSEPEAVAELLDSRWQRVLPAQLASLAWAGAGQYAAQGLSNEAPAYYQRATALWRESAPGKRQLAPWTDDMLVWQARSALRVDASPTERWGRVSLAVQAMNPSDQQDPAWVYWRARAQLALARPGADGDSDRLAARAALESIATQLNFYGKLAREDLGGELLIPPRPAPLTQAERDLATRNAGLSRALLLFGIGLRNEAVREWNFSIRGMSDRELLAAAQLACDREVWDRCINTSERTRQEVDMAQRFPMPYRAQVLAKTRDVGVDPAFVYGLIRQESRFIIDARSGVGASGLMQLMPATARWTAKKIGVPYQTQQINDREMNLLLGSSYLKLLLDDFGGSMAMATAAYNAGPGRPRRWREGPLLEPAVWAENIPFGETRDYVKKVLSNSVYYGAMLNEKSSTLKSRLGPKIGPRDASAPASNVELP